MDAQAEPYVAHKHLHPDVHSYLHSHSYSHLHVHAKLTSKQQAAMGNMQDAFVQLSRAKGWGIPTSAIGRPVASEAVLPVKEAEVQFLASVREHKEVCDARSMVTEATL